MRTSSLPRATTIAEPSISPPGASSLPATIPLSKPKIGSSQAPNVARARRPAKPKPLAPEPSSLHPARSTPKPNVAAPGATILAPTDAGSEPNTRASGPSNVGGGHFEDDPHSGRAPADYLELRMLAECFEDAQKARISCGLRMGSGTVAPDFYVAMEAAQKAVEHLAALELHRCYRRTVDPEIVAWQKAERGVGEHMLSRLFGVIAHPVHTTVHRHEGPEREVVVVGEMDRSVSQLWSYCGHGDPERKRRSGMSQEAALSLGSPRAKMLVHLIAESIVKARGPLRQVYDDRRYATADRDWTPMHKHNDALRLLGKAFLKDLWLAACGANAGEGGQRWIETHPVTAPLALVHGGAG